MKHSKERGTKSSSWCWGLGRGANPHRGVENRDDNGERDYHAGDRAGGLNPHRGAGDGARGSNPHCGVGDEEGERGDKIITQGMGTGT